MDNVNKIMKQVSKITDVYSKLEKTLFNCGDNDVLFPGAMHTISLIDELGTTTVTQLCSYQNVTKGAISHKITKLHKNGYIKKNRRIGNNKEIIISLTDTGKKAVRIHKMYHDQIANGIKLCLNKYSAKQLSDFCDLMEQLTDQLNKYEKING
jgi:DNA-binding MarR family transcriptional regulator